MMAILDNLNLWAEDFKAFFSSQNMQNLYKSVEIKEENIC
jgi:hypothetical protein